MSWLKDLQNCCEMLRTKGIARMKSMKRNTKQEDNENIKSEAPLWVRWFFHTRVRDDPEKCSNPQKKKNRYRTTLVIRACVATNSSQH